MTIESILKDRILILDGAMGTMIQRYGLTENDYRGTRFASWNVNLKGNNDLLVLSRPDVIEDIHRQYLKAGADIIETDTFNATSVSQADYKTESFVREINLSAARMARSLADNFTAQDPSKPRFVAGSVGPTNQTTSMSPDVNNPAYRAVSYDELKNAYIEQMSALIEGGVDALLIETIFDTLNAKAALDAAHISIEKSGRKVAIMLSLTLSDTGGRTLSGQTIGAFLASVMHSDILSIGLNCSFGAKDMKPFLKQLSTKAPYYISAHPNAGLPNRLGEYDETPQIMALQIKEFVDEGLVNIIGGCCGTTPAHIAEYQKLIGNAVPHKKAAEYSSGMLSGLELLEIRPENNFLNIGERCNVAGSRKFLRLINEKNYDEALNIARHQVEDGAQVIDINMDDAMLDTKNEMVNFLNLIAGEPEICRVPLMIDSSKFDVIEAALKCVQGKSIVNSISLKEGEEVFLDHARRIKNLGAATVVMAFDEKGQADTFSRRIEICQRAYNLLTQKIGFNPEDIIFDPNVLAVATGIKEHDTYALDFINATEWIKQNLPGAKVSGGVSNLSFSFRGNNYIREAMHAVFLFHAIRKGMDMGIVNPSTAVTYADIPSDLLQVIEDVILNRHPEATDRLIEVAESLKDSAVKKTESVNLLSQMNVEERLIHSLIKGNPENLAQDLTEALDKYARAIDIIDGPLMSGMNQVGELFGAGKMFLPQVVKTARTMKKAVEILQPVIEQQKGESSVSTAGKFLLATVKGDVHDIGKNIVGVILACNNFQVIDLGVMVSGEDIVRRAIEENVVFVGLSGLITPSLEEMAHVAALMEKAGLDIPLMIGGATTSAIHTAVKIAPNYSGPVFHLKDAAQNPILASQLLNKKTAPVLIENLKAEQTALRQSVSSKTLLPYQKVKEMGYKVNWADYIIPQPATNGIFELNNISIEEITGYINWKYFFNAWKVGGDYTKIAEIHGCDSCRASWLAAFPAEERMKAAEAMQLFKEANRMLDHLKDELKLTLSAKLGFLPAYSENDVIHIRYGASEINIPCLRQQQQKESGRYLSLADFIAPKSLADDYIGVFAVTVGEDFARILERYKAENDDYKSLLLQSLGDRLVEAASEWLHEKVRKEFWAYSADENLSDQQLKKMDFRGIRPAIGYPSLPDQSLIFELDKIIDYSSLGITLTEHGAMYPNASVTGFYFANPEASYFMIGDTDQEQKIEYAQKRGMSLDRILQYLR